MLWPQQQQQQQQQNQALGRRRLKHLRTGFTAVAAVTAAGVAAAITTTTRATAAVSVAQRSLRTRCFSGASSSSSLTSFQGSAFGSSSFRNNNHRHQNYSSRERHTSTIPTTTAAAALSATAAARPHFSTTTTTSSSTRRKMTTTTTTSDNNNSGNNDSIRQEKQALRKEIRSQLKLLEENALKEQSSKVWNQLWQMPLYNKTNEEQQEQQSSIGLFLSMPRNELRTQTAIVHALLQSKRVFVPQVGQHFEQADMDLIQIVLQESSLLEEASITKEIFDDWPKNKWGIPEPPATTNSKVIAQPGDLTVLIVPGLCFDRRGNRLGQGKGYYDRFIAKMTTKATTNTNTNNNLILVGVCLECQLLDPSRSVPVSEYDRPMDLLITPNETIVINPNAML